MYYMVYDNDDYDKNNNNIRSIVNVYFSMYVAQAEVISVIKLEKCLSVYTFDYIH